MKFIENFEVVELLVYFFIRVGPDFLRADVLQDDFRLFGVVPKIVLLGDAFFVFDFYFLTIVVKDTSSKPRHGPSSLSIGRCSCVIDY